MVPPESHVPVHSARAVLDTLVAAAHGRDGRTWVALDLDGTLFDNRPRTLAILRAFGLSRRHADPGLLGAIEALSPADVPYSPAAVVRSLGPDHAPLAEAFVTFWRERFFTNAFQALDHVEDGAAAFATHLTDAGLGVVYLTGRDRPGMLAGVVGALDSHGFPLATAQTMVVLKEDFATPDVAFKQRALAQLGRNGPVLGLIDNEPGIVNMAIETVPGLLGVRMCRAFAPDPPPLHAAAVQITSFRW
ncbi:MAG: HAD family hydrolase [Myxococcales bacterium]|nr:HAD family hydrolase [Myxococcales bacterium]